jgi:hypothetical protein
MSNFASSLVALLTTTPPPTYSIPTQPLSRLCSRPRVIRACLVGGLAWYAATRLIQTALLIWLLAANDADSRATGPFLISVIVCSALTGVQAYTFKIYAVRNGCDLNAFALESVLLSLPGPNPASSQPPTHQTHRTQPVRCTGHVPTRRRRLPTRRPHPRL